MVSQQFLEDGVLKFFTEQDLMFLLVSYRFDSIFEEKFENLEMESLKLGRK